MFGLSVDPCHPPHSDWCLATPASYISPGRRAPLATALSFIGDNKKKLFDAGLQRWQLNNDYNNISPFSDTKQLEEIGQFASITQL